MSFHECVQCACPILDDAFRYTFVGILLHGDEVPKACEMVLKKISHSEFQIAKFQFVD